MIKVLNDLVEGFKARVNLAGPIDIATFKVADLHKDLSLINDYKEAPGVYYFTKADTVEYVGRALRTVGLKRRINNQISVKDSKNGWHVFLKEDGVECSLLTISQEDWYFASALELLLIEKLQPRFNYRKG